MKIEFLWVELEKNLMTNKAHYILRFLPFLERHSVFSFQVTCYQLY